MADTTQAPGLTMLQRTLLAAVTACSTFAVVLLVTLSALQSQGIPMKSPPREHSRPSPIKLPGFGFDLGPDYIGVSIRQLDGGFQDFIRTNIGSEYKRYYQEASRGDPRCENDWSPKRGRQQAVPSLSESDHSSPVKVISSLMRIAKAEVEEATGLAIDKAFVAHQTLPGLCNEDIEAALDSLGVGVISNNRIHRQPTELNAVYAAYGRGLCTDFTRPNPCEYEERYEMELRYVMAVTYTDNALLIEYGPLEWAVEYMPWANNIVDYEAGAQQLGRSPDAEVHWDRVAVRLLELPLKHWNYRKPRTDVVILNGPNAGDEKLAQVINATFAKVQDHPPELLTDYGENTAARGAAEFAFRSQWQH